MKESGGVNTEDWNKTIVVNTIKIATPIMYEGCIGTPKSFP